jgi:hypothetical protein
MIGGMEAKQGAIDKLIHCFSATRPHCGGEDGMELLLCLSFTAELVSYAVASVMFSITALSPSISGKSVLVCYISIPPC